MGRTSRIREQPGFCLGRLGLVELYAVFIWCLLLFNPCRYRIFLLRTVPIAVLTFSLWENHWKQTGFFFPPILSSPCQVSLPPLFCLSSKNFYLTVILGLLKISNFFCRSRNIYIVQQVRNCLLFALVAHDFFCNKSEKCATYRAYSAGDKKVRLKMYSSKSK